jgi:hypothetical protein
MVKPRGFLRAKWPGFEPLQRPGVALARRRFIQAQGRGGVAVGHLLVVPQHKDLAVERVHAVERLLEPDLALGPHRRLAGAGQLAQEPGGQGSGAGAGHYAAVDRNLAADVAAGRIEVPPVLLLHPLADQEPDPDVERHGRIADQLVEPPHRVEVALLDHVRGVDAPLEPWVQAHRHHPSEPAPVPLE